MLKPEEKIGKTVKLLRAISHMERDLEKVRSTKSVRKAHFERDYLVVAESRARSVLQEYFGDRVSLPQFTASYLPVLKYPADIQNALVEFKINIEESRTLGRFTDDFLPKSSGYPGGNSPANDFEFAFETKRFAFSTAVESSRQTRSVIF